MAENRSWVKDNLFVIAAIALPLVVAAMFILATWLPTLYVEDPTYDLLVVIDKHHDQSQRFQVRYDVEDGQLVASASYALARRPLRDAELHRFSPSAGTIKRVQVPLPAELKAALKALDNGAEDRKETDALPLPLPAALTQLQLLAGDTAPDGYTFRNRHGRGAGLFGELFGMHGRYHAMSVEKDGRVVGIATDADDPYHYYYNNVRFLGWILP
jgi:hypothetical protein